MRERMPRPASTEENESAIVPPKRPRRAPRKRATAAPEEEAIFDGEREEEVVVEKPVTRAPRRKAPTRRVVEQAPVVSNDTPARAPASRRSRLPLIIMTVVFFAGVGVSALLGFSDKGAIDVASRIQEQSALQAGNSGEGNNNGQPIPVQNTPVDVPNGGLRGRGADATPPPPPPEAPATTTATSSDETAEENTATSTQAAPEEETEAVAEEAADTTTEAPATPAQ